MFYVIAMCALLEGTSVSAHGGGSRGRGGGSGGSGSSGGFGSSSGDGSFGKRGRCYCDWRSPCTGTTPSQVIGCPNTNSFLQCTGTACAVQACPTGKVWDYLKNACSECDAGKHISLSNGQVCVCNQGTTLDPRTNKCVSCPSAAITETDRCFCPSNLALDSTNKVCKACPAEAPIRGSKCLCTSPTLFFNQDTWTCTSCPGTLVGPLRRYQSYSCSCNGANQIFYKKNASCYTCPAGTTASREKCLCPRNSRQKFDYTSGTCACAFGQTLNASGVCAINPPALNP